MKKTVTTFLLAISSIAFGQRSDIDSLVSLAQDTTKIGQVPVYIHLSKIYYHISKDTCRIYAEKAVESGMKARDNVQIALALTHLAYFNEKIKNYEFSLEKIEEASNYAHLANDSNTIAWVHDRWAHICHQQDQLAATLEHYKKAIDYAKGNYSLSSYARLIINTATLIDDVEDYDLALQYYSIVLDMINNGDSLSARIVGQLYNSLGDYYSQLKKYDKAENYMLQAYDIKKQTNQANGQIVALGNLSTVYKHTGRYKEAEEVILKAYRLSDSIKNERYSTSLASMVGSLYFDLKQYSKAEGYFKKGVELAEKNGYSTVLASGHLDLCRLYLLQGKLTYSEDQLLRSLEIGHTTPDKELLMEIYRVKTSLDSTKGDFSTALADHMIYLSYKDSLLNDSKQQSITNYEVKYETAQKENEIQLLTKDNEVKAIKTAQLTQLRNGLIIGTLLLILLVAFIYRSYYNKKKSLAVIKKQKAAIQEKSDENELLVKEVHHRVKNNLQIILSLLNAQTNMLREDDKAIQIIGESQNRIKSLALIHQDLYQSNNLVKVNSKNYFENLLDNIQNTYSSIRTDINITANIENMELKMALAVPLGLILNELVTNSYKYAFKKSKNGRITIYFEKDCENRYLLKVTDNGQGISNTYYSNDIDSFGLQLVKGLTDQLGGTIDIEVDEGTHFDIAVMDLEEVA